MPDRDIRNAASVLQVILDWSFQVQNDVYMCFIIYLKAFDRVKHKGVIHILGINIDVKELGVVQEVYYSQTAIVSVGQRFSKEFTIEKSVTRLSMLCLFSHCGVKKFWLSLKMRLVVKSKGENFNRCKENR